MAQKTSIEWTDATWSPVLGCSPASAGCAACYATRTVWRMAHNPNRKIAEARAGLVEKTSAGVLRWTGAVRCLPDQLEVPLRWKEPRRIFVANQSDLFHEAVPDDFIAQVFAVMALAPRHTFQVLTKRAARMAELLRSEDFWSLVGSWSDLMLEDEESPVGPGRGWNGLERRSDDARALAQAPTADEPLENAWLGVSVEDQRAADERIPHLMQTPAALRFVSAEPLLGPVDLRHLYGHVKLGECVDLCVDALAGKHAAAWAGRGTIPDRPLPRGAEKLDWVIVGGESGPSARPCDVAWVRSLVEQCRAAGVPAFVKQLGRAAASDVFLGPNGGCGYHPLRLRDRKGGDPAEWPEDLRVREMPEVRR